MKRNSECLKEFSREKSTFFQLFTTLAQKGINYIFKLTFKLQKIVNPNIDDRNFKSAKNKNRNKVLIIFIIVTYLVFVIKQKIIMKELCIH